MLREHLLWNYNHPSAFSSWSSSILWVLEHAARMHTTESKPHVHIAVLDTRKIQDIAIFPAVALMDVYGVPADGDVNGKKLSKEYYTAEYLFHGPLKNALGNSYYTAVSWKAICAADTCGSLRVFSHRSAADTRLLLRINELRQEFENPTVLDLEVLVPTVIAIGAKFGGEDEAVVTIALLALLCGSKMPAASDLLREMRARELQLPEEAESIVAFDVGKYIPEELSEVVRMYSLLSQTFSLSLGDEEASQNLVEGVASLGLGR